MPDGRSCVDLAMECALRVKEERDWALVSTDDRTLVPRWPVTERPAITQDYDKVIDEARRILVARDAFDTIVLLQPTSPLRTDAHVKAAIDLYHASGASAVCTLSGDPLRRDGTVYVASRETILQCGDWFGRTTRYIVLPETVNIDTPADWDRAVEQLACSSK